MESLASVPWPVGAGFGGALVVVIGTWLRFVLLTAASAQRQQDGWQGIVARLDADLAEARRERDELRDENADLRAEVNRLWRNRNPPS